MKWQSQFPRAQVIQLTIMLKQGAEAEAHI